MSSANRAKSLSLMCILMSACTFAFIRQQDMQVSTSPANPEVVQLRKTYKIQTESLRMAESSIQNLTDEAIEILPEWLGTLEGRDQSSPVTKADVKEVCDGLRSKLRSPARCQPYLTRRLHDRRDDINRLWQSRKSDLHTWQLKYKSLKLELENTVGNLQKLGADISEN